MGTRQSELCQLASKYGTDKLGVYTAIYELILKHRNISRILEVGIGTPEAMSHVKGYKPGASLRMWRDYGAEVVGIDVSLKAVLDAADDGIRTIQWDSTQELPIDLGKFDLIIDDGSHKPEDQLATFNNLFKHLSSGGLYIIEDVDEWTVKNNLLSPYLPEHTLFFHYSDKGIGRAIVIQCTTN